MTRRLARPALVALLVCVSLLSLVEVWLIILNGPGPHPHVFAFPGSNALVGIITVAVGAFILWRHPTNLIGWAMCAGGFFPLLSEVTGEYSARAASYTGSLPAGPFMGWLADWIYLVGLGSMFIVLVLFFPDGRLPSRRWRPLAWLSSGVLAAYIALDAISLGLYRVDLLGPGFPDALSHDPHSGLLHETIRILAAAFTAVGVPAAVLALVAPIVRLRRATGKERQQLKWFVFAAVVLFVYDLFFLSAQTNLPLGLTESLVEVVQVGFPVVVAIAILRYDLYDIDVVINKSLVYGALAVFISAVYVGIVVGIGSLLGNGGKPDLALSIVATAIVAVAFQPVRERVQQVANRLVYGERATPYEVMADFAERMSGALSVEEVLPGTAEAAARSVGARAAGVTLFLPQGERTGVWPNAAGSQDLDRTFPIAYRGEQLGELAIKKATGEPLTAAEQRLLSDLTAQAGLVLHNVRLTAELQARLAEISEQAIQLRASRQRLVSAQDSERRRLEQTIHEGAERELAGMASRLHGIVGALETSPQQAAAALEQLTQQATGILEALRDLARGIYPPLLGEQGLAAALRAQAARIAVPIDVVADGIGRYPAEVESAVYFACLEALRSVRRPSRIRLDTENGGLCFTITALELAPERLQDIEDRIEALDGQVVIRDGSVLTASIPALSLKPVG